MPRIDADGFYFDFPERWIASKYDDWAFYREHWSRIGNGIKSVDIVAVSPDRTGWLIEVKDYGEHPRTKPSDLAQEVVDKVLDTLAAILPAAVNATDDPERTLAFSLCRAERLRIVLHLELPAAGSRLHRNAVDPADVLQKLRQRLKPVDRTPIVTAMAQMRGVPWRVVRR